MSSKRRALISVSAPLFLLLLPSFGEARQGQEVIAQVDTFLSCLDSTQTPSFLGEKISGAFEGKLPQIIEHLNAKLGLPVSFIEGPALVQIEIRVQNEPVRSFLGRLLGQARGYRCAVIENHVVIYHDGSALHEVVERVVIEQQLRGQAAHAYVDLIARQVQGFEGLGVFLGGALESPIIDERITLARKATVLEHFCQLLGSSPGVFFWLRYASTGSRYLTFGATLGR